MNSHLSGPRVSVSIALPAASDNGLEGIVFASEQAGRVRGTSSLAMRELVRDE